MSYLAAAKKAEQKLKQCSLVVDHVDADEAATQDDPILSLDQWYPEFHRFHAQVVQETPNLDWQWLREQRPDLYQTIKDRENELDALGDARLSRVMGITREWRELILRAENERQGANEQKDR